MRWSIIISILIIVTSYAQDQDDDKLYDMLTEIKTNEYLDILVNASTLIPELYNRGEIDSIRIIVDYIERRYETTDFDLLKMLLDIESGRFEPDWCDSLKLDNIFNLTYLTSWDYLCAIRSYREFGLQTYNDFIKERAFSLASILDTNSVAYLVCRVYSHDTDYVIDRLKANQFDGFCIQDTYNKYVAKTRWELRKVRSHLSVGAGNWVPPNDILGFTTELSASMGLRWFNWGGDLTGSIRIPFSTNDYMIVHNGSLTETDFFIGYMIGMEITREIYHSGRFELEGFTGIAYDGFYASKGNDRKNIGSFCFNFGATARLYYNRTRNYYLGVKFRYNLVDYDNKGGTDFSGNTFSISLVWGLLGNPHAIQQADQLRLFDK